MLLSSISDHPLQSFPDLESSTALIPPPWLDGGLAVLNPAGEIIEVNPPLADWLARPAGQLVGARLLTTLAGRCAAWDREWAALDGAGQTFTRAEWTLPRQESEPGQRFRAELTRHTAAKVFRLESLLPALPELQEQGCERCLSAEPSRRETFFRLVRAEERLEQLTQRWPGIVFSQRPDGTFYFVSPGIEELTGVPVCEWEKEGDRFWAVIHEADELQVRQHLQRAQNSAEAETSTFRVRHVRTGKVAYILEHRQAVRTGSGLLLGYEGVWLDLTRQTLVEKRLNTTAWKETLSALMMGLAHDLRNNMTGIIGMSEVFQGQLESQHPFQEGLALIRSNASRASQSIQRILQLHQGKSGERRYADLNELARDMAEMTEKMFSRLTTIEARFAEGQLPLYADAFEFRQAFLNLAVNARDAMPKGGRLTVVTSRHESLPELKFVRGKPPRLPAICLTMSDTGTGIDPEHLPSLFDPFFTTKGPEHGSGLGLYNVLLFVERHGGAVSVESPAGQGATFRLWLPEADFTEGEQDTASAKATGGLLLVGVPGQALESTAAFLRQAGFEVSVAAGPERALAQLRAPQRPFAAVLAQTTAKSLELFSEIAKAKLPVKRILQVVGRNQDEVETAWLRSADLVVGEHANGPELISRIRSLLAGSTQP